MIKLTTTLILTMIVLAACSTQPPLNNSATVNGETAVNSAVEITPQVNSNEATPAPAIKVSVVLPIGQFFERITKKPFGIYITPKISPVQPERFTGYHTGADVEYQDVTGTVPVQAIADGIVERSGWVSGYGGMLAIRHNIDGQKYLAIYGHLNPASLIANGQSVVKGEQIGILGLGFSRETDNERRHLHFALYPGSDINIKGYVQSAKELINWIDPVKFFQLNT